MNGSVLFVFTWFLPVQIGGLSHPSHVFTSFIPNTQLFYARLVGIIRKYQKPTSPFLPDNVCFTRAC